MKPSNTHKTNQNLNSSSAKRPIGFLKGKIKIAEDFDTLPEEIINAFYK